MAEIRAQLSVALFGLLCSGCFDPAPPKPCMPCEGAEMLCPSGQTCMDGLCKTDADACASPAPQCSEACCIDGACFELNRHMPPDSLALWLDWTSLYESEKKPIWSDRSPHAYSFRSEGTSPTLYSSTERQRDLLRFDGVGQYLVLSSAEQPALDKQDFLLMVAGSLSCKPRDIEARPCLVTRLQRDKDEQKRRGLRLCATRSVEQPSSITTCSDASSDPQCVSGLVSDVACNQMQLFTLSRLTPDDAEAMSGVSQFELRHNTQTAAQLALDADMPIDVVSPLRIGGRAGNSLIGDVAFVALIVGKLSPRQRCELESFVLQQLAAADMATAAPPPDCSAL